MFDPNIFKGIIQKMDYLALYGAITGTVGTIVSILVYRRDRIKIHIDVQRERKIINAEPQYKSNKLYTCVRVANKGRRPVTIVNVGYEFMRRKGGAILSDSMIYGSREINEGKGADFLVEEDELEYEDIAFFYAIDAVGNKYKKIIGGYHKQFLYWLLDFLKIRKKPNVFDK